MSSDTNPPPSSQSARLAAIHNAHRCGRRGYLVAALLLLLSLGAGAAIGIGGTVIYYGDRFKRPPRPEEVGDAITKKIIDFLELNEKESADLKKAVAARMEKVGAIRAESWSAIRAEFDELSRETAEIVGEERYQKWAAERDRRLGERRRLHDKEGPHGERRRNHERPNREFDRESAPPPPPGRR